MMSGEKKFLSVVLCISLICITVVVSWLFIALWQMKELLALGLLGLGALAIVTSVAVTALGHLNEQHLRRRRVLYKAELPLDSTGHPLYLPDDVHQAHYYPPYTQHHHQGGYYYE
jgi:hypothetical protein